jgi:multidrug efflux system membrane fusion protein
MDFVDNRVDQATGTMQGRAVFPNPDYLLTPGLFARVRLLSRGPYAALLIPDAAFAADQARRFVFVVDADGLAQRRVVEFGRRLGELRVITNGLGPDDRVIVGGIQRVRAGSPVTVKEASLADPDAIATGGDGQPR